jgi:hypothetical protein
VFPAGYAEYQVRVGDFFGIYDLTGFSLDAFSTVSACFGCGSLIDLGQGGQNDVVLVICHWI